MSILCTEHIAAGRTDVGIEIEFDLHFHDSLDSLNAVRVPRSELEEAGIQAMNHRRQTAGCIFMPSRNIHVWVTPHTELGKAVGTIAHEIGHSLSPVHRDHDKDETKASKYEGAAYCAIYALQQYRSAVNRQDPYQHGQAG
jgi:hypothetical protein